MHPVEPVEFCRPTPVDRISSSPSRMEITPNAAERAALAERFGLLSLEGLSARFTLRRLRKDLIRVVGHLEAEVVQACVVTLDPVPARIAEDFELDFIEGAGTPSDELELDIEAADAPEPLQGPEIDLGEVAAEQLGLALDPYPRKPGAAIPEKWVAEEAPEPVAVEKVNPFAALEKLKKGGEPG